MMTLILPKLKFLKLDLNNVCFRIKYSYLFIYKYTYEMIDLIVSFEYKNNLNFRNTCIIISF